MDLKVEKPILEQPVLPVRWCLTPEELESLKNQITGKDITKVVILVEYAGDAPDNKDVFIAPYDQIMEYIPLRKAGDVKLTPFVLWGKWKDNSSSKERRDQVKDIVFTFTKNIDTDSPRHSVYEYLSDWECIVGETLTAFVPDGIFAKEPSKFERWWVNYWYESSPKDQCQFRRRRILAYTFQPICVLIWSIIIGIPVRFWLALVETMAGFKNVAWEDVLHPFRATITDIFESGDHPKKISGSIGSNAEHEFKKMWIFFTMVALLRLIIFSLKIMPDVILPGLTATFWITYVLVAIIFIPLLFIPAARLAWLIFKYAVVAAIAALIMNIITPHFFSQAKIEARRSKKEEKERLKQEQLYADIYDVLSCGCSPKPELSALPPQYRKIRLRFKNLKSKVCKTFQS